MVITKKNLLEYPLIPKIVEEDRKKLKKLKENPPTAIHGKVVGSSADFPFQLRHFTVSGPDFADNRDWKNNVRYLEIKLPSEINFYNDLKLKLDIAIADLKDIRLKLIVEYTLRGYTQEKIAKEVFLDRSVISRELDKFIDIFNGNN